MLDVIKGAATMKMMSSQHHVDHQRGVDLRHHGGTTPAAASATAEPAVCPSLDLTMRSSFAAVLPRSSGGQDG
jgi:hypothetical protein